MANGWIQVLKTVSDRIKLAAVVDLDMEAAKGIVHRHALTDIEPMSDLGQALNRHDPQIVFDVTVPPAHHGVTTSALRHGCHVLGAKPMAVTLEQGKEIAAAAEKAGRLHAVTQARRPLVGMMHVARLLNEGVIGQVEEVHCDFYLGAHFGGFRDGMEQPLILDTAIHTFDNARQLSGADPVGVFCRPWNPLHSWSKGDMSAMAIFDMARGDELVVYTYRGSWVAEGMSIGWEADWRIVGSKGTLHFDGNSDIVGETLVPDVEQGFTRPTVPLVVPPVPKLEHEGHAALIRNFLDAVESNGSHQPLCPAADNIKSLAMVLAAAESARQKRWLPVVW